MPFRLLLFSDERFRDAAILRGLLERNMPPAKSSALLLLITSADHRRVPVRLLGCDRGCCLRIGSSLQSVRRSGGMDFPPPSFLSACKPNSYCTFLLKPARASWIRCRYHVIDGQVVSFEQTVIAVASGGLLCVPSFMGALDRQSYDGGETPPTIVAIPANDGLPVPSAHGYREL